MRGREISIWFFIGVSLLGNGILIAGAGLSEVLHPPLHPTVVLFQYHANLWWGFVLLVIGAAYCVKYAPVRQPQKL